MFVRRPRLNLTLLKPLILGHYSLALSLTALGGLSHTAFAADINTYRAGTPYHKISAQAHQQCEQQCTGDAACRSWNFVKPNPHSRSGICEFNSRTVRAISSPVSISGTVNTAIDPLMSRAVQRGTNTIKIGSPAPIQATIPASRPVNPRQNNTIGSAQRRVQNTPQRQTITHPVMTQKQPTNMSYRPNMSREQNAPRHQAVSRQMARPSHRPQNNAAMFERRQRVIHPQQQQIAPNMPSTVNGMAGTRSNQQAEARQQYLQQQKMRIQHQQRLMWEQEQMARHQFSRPQIPQAQARTTAINPLNPGLKQEFLRNQQALAARDLPQQTPPQRVQPYPQTDQVVPMPQAQLGSRQTPFQAHQLSQTMPVPSAPLRQAPTALPPVTPMGSLQQTTEYIPYVTTRTQLNGTSLQVPVRASLYGSLYDDLAASHTEVPRPTTFPDNLNNENAPIATSRKQAVSKRPSVAMEVDSDMAAYSLGILDMGLEETGIEEVSGLQDSGLAGG